MASGLGIPDGGLVEVVAAEGCTVAAPMVGALGIGAIGPGGQGEDGTGAGTEGADAAGSPAEIVMIGGAVCAPTAISGAGTGGSDQDKPGGTIWTFSVVQRRHLRSSSSCRDVP